YKKKFTRTQRNQQIRHTSKHNINHIQEEEAKNTNFSTKTTQYDKKPPKHKMENQIKNINKKNNKTYSNRK
ncbi:hypothetical protein, partial [Erwinia amylovora]|uniref:hypothetical protein n=1 Tax=Erwinia amylovora TaxID=552 RepID=UPI0020BFDB95